MSRRNTIPLHKNRQEMFVDVLTADEDLVDPHKAMTSHLLLGTGIRNDTCGHTHKSWFTYRGDELYLDIPDFDNCRKEIDKARKGPNSNENICGSCEGSGDGGYTPKTPTSAGRQLLIPNSYKNHVTGEVEYFGLKDRCERYFAFDEPAAPTGSEYGFDMIQADGKDGFSAAFANKAVRAVGAKSDINPTLRKKQLIQEGVPNDKIRKFGTNKEGDKIPDIVAHDMRASYCTQLARNDVRTAYAMTKTGHKLEETFYRYVNFARNELDKNKDKSMF